jgi:hypothetical protein
MDDHMGNGDYEGEFELPPEHEEETKQIQEQCSREIRERLALLDDKFSVRFDNRMTDIGERYKQHVGSHVRDRQTDVLRSNKVIREVSRELGSDWKFVFQSLMAGFPMDVITAEIERIERQRPFMQPYKALVRWRDMKGENFNINDLIDVLKTMVKDELAARALAILHCQGDALYALDHKPNTRIASGVELRDEEGDFLPLDGAEGMAVGLNGRGNHSNGDELVGGAVGDRNLLQVARKLGKDWFQVGTCLDLPSEELDEIKNAEGDSYQAAFRMLWLWRDTAGQGGYDTPSVLGDALKAAGRSDLEEILH